MATHDVDARLAQGRSAVDAFWEYVRACQHLGYAHPDLTERVGQVHDWYASEAGLRLDALAADAEALRLVAQAADHVTQQQADLVAELTKAWSGRGADPALEFLARNQRVAVTTGAVVRDSADALSSLCDQLWGAVDAKVSATLSIDGQRADWLAAARTVTSGAGDRSSASELVDQQVKPFVDDVIGTRWVNEMRSSTSTIEDAYRAALARLRATAETVFEVPGQLGPRWVDPAAPTVSFAHVDSVVTPSPTVLAAPAAVAPAGYSPPPTSPPLDPIAADPVAQQPLPTAGSSAAPASPLGDLGSLGSGAAGSGLSGFGQQLADLLGGLMGGSGDDAADLDPLDPDDEDTDDDPKEDDHDDDAEEEVETEEDEPPADPVAADPAPPTASPVTTATADPVPALTPVPETSAPPSAEESAPPPPEPTPCEIAADELPQVGD